MAMTTMMRSSHHHCGHIAGQGQGVGKGNAGAHRHDNDAIVASLSWSLRRASERESEGGRGVMAHGQCCVILIMRPCCNDMVALCCSCAHTLQASGWGGDGVNRLGGAANG